jgi:hypothetical protein
MLCWLLCIILLIYILNKFTKNKGFARGRKNKFINEGYTDKSKVQELLKKKHIFKPGVTYGFVKTQIEWIDSVIYDEVYKESLKNGITESFLAGINF